MRFANSSSVGGGATGFPCTVCRRRSTTSHCLTESCGAVWTGGTDAVRSDGVRGTDSAAASVGRTGRGGTTVVAATADATAVGENVAPQVRGPVICVCPSGAQSPTNPMNVKPASAVGCNSTGTPSGWLAEQTDPLVPQMISTPSMVPPVGTGAIVSSCVVAGATAATGAKVAPQVRGAVMTVRPPGAQSPV